MPKVYRSTHEDAGKPKVGADTCQLGVRPPGHPVNVDMSVDAGGNVVLDGGGMSVFPSIASSELKRVPRRLIPLRLASKVPGAVGDNDMRIRTTGSGVFASAPMTATLKLHVTGRTHGTLCPSHSMKLDELQSELAKTQPDWTVEEP